jgi:hypothetical protein
LQNINCLPDKVSPVHETASAAARNGGMAQEPPRTQAEIDTENEEFMNAANMAFSSPNPNFIVLDRELLENIQESSEPVASFTKAGRKSSATDNKDSQSNGTSSEQHQPEAVIKKSDSESEVGKNVESEA